MSYYLSENELQLYSEVFFDVETKKLFGDIEGYEPGDLGVSIVSLYSRKVDESVGKAEGRKILSEVEGKIHSFWEEDFEDMWPIFQEADRIVGFNSIGFDVPALIPYANFPFHKLPHFDVMLKVKEVYGRRIPMDAIAKETLDRQKKETGLEAVYLWQKGDKKSLQRLREYCEDDVIITKEIYDFGFKNGHLLFKDKWNTLRKVYIDFSYPKEPRTKQTGLF